MTHPPFETIELRNQLREFLDMKVRDPIGNRDVAVGNYKFGVYAFFDYDAEPIYVGQTNEQLRTRIRRHLTNQRTDAVAMKCSTPSRCIRSKSGRCLNTRIEIRGTARRWRT
jgi:hypothetical protein